MGGVRPGAGFESPAAMRRLWLAGIFAFCALWAVLVGVVSNDHVHELWGVIAAVGYGLAVVVVLAVRHPRAADAALGFAFLGGLVVPLAYLATRHMGQPEVAVVAASGQSLIHHGTPYMNPDKLRQLGQQYLYNPYLPLMALFGLPVAFSHLGVLTDPRLWFGLVFLVIFWFALRR